ncbi:Holliday junction branch migration DNA helicase RuvB, partial [Mycobacterium tuberculosis]
GDRAARRANRGEHDGGGSDESHRSARPAEERRERAREDGRGEGGGGKGPGATSRPREGAPGTRGGATTRAG